MLKVLGIVGSPHNHGNTAFLVENSLDVIDKEDDFEVELITLGDKNINYCVGCDKCKKTNRCTIDDDMRELTAKVRDADALIVGSPVYFGDMTGQLKTFIDRLRPLRNIHAFKFKVCGAVSAGGFRNGGQEATIASIHDFFLVQGGIVVGDNRPTAHFGATGVGDTSKDDVGIDTSVYLAQRIIDVTRRLNE
jgi:multimeric flavodoxin WrbA